MALNNLAQGTLDEAQVKLFQDQNVPHEAIHLFRTNAEVDSFNSKIIDKDPNKVTVEAVDKLTVQHNERLWTTKTHKTHFITGKF